MSDPGELDQSGFGGLADTRRVGPDPRRGRVGCIPLGLVRYLAGTKPELPPDYISNRPGLAAAEVDETAIARPAFHAERLWVTGGAGLVHGTISASRRAGGK